MSTVAVEHVAQAAPTFPQPTQRSAGSHVMLWSQSQCALHIEPVERMLSCNRRAYADDRRMDFVPLFIGTEDDCGAIASAIRGTMHARQDERRAIVEGLVSNA